MTTLKLPDSAEGMLGLLSQMTDSELEEMFQAHQQLEQRLRMFGPQTDDELHDWIKAELGIDIPRTSVCEGHCAPFDFLADLYFERTEAALGVGNRGGAKTFIVAVLHWLNSRFKPGCESCVTADTPLDCPRDHRRFPDGIPISQIKPGQLVWTFNEDIRRFELKPVVEARMTRKDAPIFKLTLDSGHVIRATADHRFMRRDGSWAELRELAPGDSLMPLYRDYEPYVRVNPDARGGGQMIPEYHAVADVLWPERKGMHVDHVDERRENSEAENLQLLTPSEHCRKTMKGRNFGLREVKPKMTLSEAGRKGGSKKKPLVAHTCSCGEVYHRPAGGRQGLCPTCKTEARTCPVCGEFYVVQRKSRKQTCSYSCGQKMRHAKEAGVWNHKVVSIEPDGSEDVWDVEVEDNHNFVAHGVVLHNCTFGATEAQSLRCYAHLKNWIYDPDGNKRPDVVSSLMRETVFRNGSKVEVLAGTEQAVNGPHPQKAHADEIELMDDGTWRESRNMRQPLDSLIATLSGWCRMGDLRVGDKVIGLDGRPKRVLAVHEISEQPIYRVELTDGRFTECCDEHLWMVCHQPSRSKGSRFKVLQTQEMLATGLKRGANYLYGLPLIDPVDFPEVDLPIDPYVFGVLIGDGCLRERVATFRANDDDIREEVERRLPETVRVAGDTKNDGTITYRISQPTKASSRNPVMAELERLGLLGRGSHDKFIPGIYKLSSPQQRLDLLRGLMDTDGSFTKEPYFATVSERLAQDVSEIVYSLGGRGLLRKKKTSASAKAWGSCGYIYEVSVSLPDDIPFLCERKRHKFVPRKRTLGAAIRSITPVGRKPARCISVEGEMYLTDSYIPTHNTVSGYLPDGRVIIPQDIATSTRKGPNGRVQALIDEIEKAVKEGFKPPRKLYMWCFPPGTPVRTLRGFVPIEDVQEGDMVLSRGGVFRRVSATHVREVENETAYTIKTPTSLPIIATGEHPFMAVIDEREHDLARKPVNRRIRGFVTDWVDAADLRVGAYVETVVPQETMTLDAIEPPAWTLGDQQRKGQRRKAHVSYVLSDDFLWAIGLYIAEGHAAQGVISYALHEDEQGYADRLRSVFEPLGFTVSIGRTTGRCISVNVYSTQLAEWWPQWIGAGSENKAIPSELLTLDLDRLRHVVEGVMDGDGGRSVNTLGQTSPILAMQMTEIALREGGNPSVHLVHREGRKTAYQLYQADGQVQIAPQYAMTLTMERKHKQPRGFWRMEERTFVKVTQHEKTHYCGPVHDLTVEGDPSFVVGNLLVHNCLKETAAQVKNCQIARPDLPDSEKCSCHTIRKGEWEDGSSRLLRDVCNGDFYKSRGWQPFGDIAKQFTENDRDTFEVQQLCLKPEMRHHYVPAWRDEKHAIRGFLPDPENGPIFTSTDWGGTNPHSVGFYQLLRNEVEVRAWIQPDESKEPVTVRIQEGTIVRFDEIYIAEIGNDKLGELVKQKEAEYRKIFPKFRVMERFADPQGKAARLDWKAIGLRTTWHTTREFEEHIKVVSDTFEDDLFRVNGEKCPMFLWEVKQWRRHPKTDEQIDENNHAMSEFRYCLANVKKIRKKALRQGGSKPQARSIPRHTQAIRRGESGPIGFRGTKDEYDQWRASLGEPVTRVRRDGR